MAVGIHSAVSRQLLFADVKRQAKRIPTFDELTFILALRDSKRDGRSKTSPWSLLRRCIVVGEVREAEVRTAIAAFCRSVFDENVGQPVSPFLISRIDDADGIRELSKLLFPVLQVIDGGRLTCIEIGSGKGFGSKELYPPTFRQSAEPSSIVGAFGHAKCSVRRQTAECIRPKSGRLCGVTGDGGQSSVCKAPFIDV